jgi:hypothetical protein
MLVMTRAIRLEPYVLSKFNVMTYVFVGEEISGRVVECTRPKS